MDHAYWILPHKADFVDSTHALEYEVIKDLGVPVDQFEPDDFGPTFFATKEIAERVMGEMMRRRPEMLLELMES